ncbi:AbgT family transporter [Campylobacter sp. Marseille-Q3452]|uniref:AbgT family transporter n=1 Tax=Campylobacter massiliensis TaxID=2762557 RepID=A0A842JC45_9BACT|nr:AbgT family transporter [Campylobacter massiliensis]MBC2883013.1 AbgT family transporter [Campylobacter massiliensis]
MDNKNSGSILGFIEKFGNKLPNPTMLFVYLSVVTILLSFVLQRLGVGVSYQAIKDGQISQLSANVVNLLSADSIRTFVSSMLKNFTGFYPLGVVFAIILGIGVADKAGLLSALVKKIALNSSKKWVTPIVIFLGVMSNVASSVGYVVLIPLGAILFAGFGRHPIAGLAAAFAGVSGGWSANLLIGTNDPMFAAFSTQAASVLNPDYVVLATANWYFMIASTFLIVIVGSFVTDRIVEPRLGKFSFEGALNLDERDEISAEQRRGLKFALIASVVFAILLLAALLPSNSLFGAKEGESFTKSVFMHSIIIFMMLFFIVAGAAYGVGAGTIKNSGDAVKFMEQAVAELSGFLVLIFFAAQFTYLFNASNIGLVLSIKGSVFLKDIGLTGLSLIIVFIVVIAFINLFIAVDSAKWAMMAPIFVPMFMNLGLSPELTQAAFRIGDSTTNIITPLMPFFVLIVAFMQRYDKGLKIGSVVSIMLPYTVAFLLSWAALMSVWYAFDLPLGPGAAIHYLK